MDVRCKPCWAASADGHDFLKFFPASAIGGMPLLIKTCAQEIPFKTLEEGERFRFSLGATSVLFVNLRERNSVDSEMQLVRAKADYQKALALRERYTRAVDSYEEFKQAIEEGGFILAHWDGTAETEEKVKNETKATIRCIPLEGDRTPGRCMVTGAPSERRVLFARAY